MAVRLLEIEELPELTKEAEKYYREHYPNESPFHSRHFHDYWNSLMISGAGMIFIEEDEGKPLGAFGCVRTQNQFTGEPEYFGAFTVIMDFARGRNWVLTLMDDVLYWLAQMTPNASVTVMSTNPITKRIWNRLGFTDELFCHRRRL